MSLSLTHVSHSRVSSVTPSPLPHFPLSLTYTSLDVDYLFHSGRGRPPWWGWTWGGRMIRIRTSRIHWVVRVEIMVNLVSGLVVKPESRGLVRRERKKRTWVDVNVKSVGVGRCVYCVSDSEEREGGVGVVWMWLRYAVKKQYYRRSARFRFLKILFRSSTLFPRVPVSPKYKIRHYWNRKYPGHFLKTSTK